MKKTDYYVNNHRIIKVREFSGENYSNSYSFLNKYNNVLPNNIKNKINVSKIVFFSLEINSILFNIHIFVTKTNRESMIQIKKKIIRLLYFILFFVTNKKLISIDINIILCLISLICLICLILQMIFCIQHMVLQH